MVSGAPDFEIELDDDFDVGLDEEDSIYSYDSGIEYDNDDEGHSDSGIDWDAGLDGYDEDHPDFDIDDADDFDDL